jgi:hypothetical protein
MLFKPKIYRKQGSEYANSNDKITGRQRNCIGRRATSKTNNKQMIKPY